MSKKERSSPTPSATLYTIGTRKTGNDGNTWIITQNINGTKRWKLYKNVSKKRIKSLNNFGFIPVYEKKLDKIMELHKPIYDKIKKYIIPELNKLGINTYLIPLPLSENGYYFTDYAPEYITEVYK